MMLSASDILELREAITNQMQIGNKSNSKILRAVLLDICKWLKHNEDEYKNCQSVKDVLDIVRKKKGKDIVVCW